MINEIVNLFRPNKQNKSKQKLNTVTPPINFNKNETVYRSLCDEIRKDSHEFASHLEMALRNGFPIDYIPPNSNMSCLHFALMRGFYNSVEILLNNGADVNLNYSCGTHEISTLYMASNHKIPLNLFYRIANSVSDVNNGNNLFKTHDTPINRLCIEYITQVSDTKLNDLRTKIKILLDAGADPYENVSWRIRGRYYNASLSFEKIEKRQDFIDGYITHCIEVKNELSSVSSGSSYDYEL